MKIAPIVDADIPVVIDLWQRCNLARPWNDSAADIALARRDENSDILIGRDGDAIDPAHQGKDFGRAVMAAAEDWLRARGIEKLMLLVRSDNTKVQKFYEKLDYVEQDRVLYAKWLDGRPMTP